MKRLRYNSEPKREETKPVPESMVVAVSERRARQGAEQKMSDKRAALFGSLQAEARSAGGEVVT